MDDRLREIEERVARASEAHARFKGGDTFGDADSKAMARFQIAVYEDIPYLLQQLRLLRVLANGCPKHPSYRAKRKVNTICETCNAMWEARAALGGK